MKSTSVKNNSKVIRALNSTLEKLTECEIGYEYIMNNSKDTLSMVPINSLEMGKPVIMRHCVGVIFVVIPGGDWLKLMSQQISVKEYVAKSIWHFGHIFFGTNLSEKIYWQAIENGKPGINDTKKVHKYLSELKYRNENKIVEEVYARVGEKVKSELGLKVVSGLKFCEKLDKYPEGFYIAPGFTHGTVTVTVSQHTLINMFYNPNAFNADKIMQTYKLIEWENFEA